MREPDPSDFSDAIKARRAAAECLGKEAFADPALAHLAAKRGKRKGRNREAYRCTCCNLWHIGTPAHTRARGKPKPDDKPKMKRPRNRNGVRLVWSQE